MSNEDKFSQEQAFLDWLDSASRKETHFDDEHWQARKNTVNKLEHHIEMSGEQPIPQWDRASTFTGESRGFWQWQGLPMLSMVCSVFAIALVLFKVEVSVSDSGLLVNFAGNTDAMIDQKVTRLVNSKLQDFAQEQQVVLANYAADIKVKQQDNNLQLASYIMGVSRQERKEDISDFIQYINAQRQDEQLEQRIKYQRLEHAINASAPHRLKNINNLDLQQNDTENDPAVLNLED